jgi:membrane-associated phospholipid phosphatase
MNVGTVLTVNVVVAGALDALDEQVWELFVNNPLFISVARAVTSVGVLSVLLPLCVLSGIYMWRATSSPLIAAAPWIAVQFNSVVVASLKDWTNVVRPPREFWLTAANAGSFPSGHVANTTAFVVVNVLVLSQIHGRRKQIFLTAGVVACVAMAWSRLALNVHWLSDVVAGWFVGTASAFVVLQLVQRIKSQRENQLQTPG